jgi:uncharacterized protein
MQNIKFHFFHFLKFVSFNSSLAYFNISKAEKLKNTIVYLLIIDFIIVNILWYLVVLAEHYSFFNPLKENNQDYGIPLRYLSACVIAPLLEEGIFRLPLGYCRSHKLFPLYFYFSSILFGVIHFYNYEYDNTHILFLLFITSPQIFSGFFLGYIRIIYGFWYGVFFHGVYNFIGLTLTVLG